MTILTRKSWRIKWIGSYKSTENFGIPWGTEMMAKRGTEQGNLGLRRWFERKPNLKRLSKKFHCINYSSSSHWKARWWSQRFYDFSKILLWIGFPPKAILRLFQEESESAALGLESKQTLFALLGQGRVSRQDL